jgi:hypothetical protein
MIAKARDRLGSTLVLCDAVEISVATASVSHALSVWVFTPWLTWCDCSVEPPPCCDPGGRYVVCATQRPAADDAVGQIIVEMGAQIDARRGAVRAFGVTTEEVVALVRHGWIHPGGSPRRARMAIMSRR